MRDNTDSKSISKKVKALKEASVWAASISVIILTVLSTVIRPVSENALIRDINESLSPNYVDSALTQRIRIEFFAMDFLIALLSVSIFVMLFISLLKQMKNSGSKETEKLTLRVNGLYTKYLRMMMTMNIFVLAKLQ